MPFCSVISSQTPVDVPIEVIAHRGYSAVAPENTLASVRAALEAGAHSVEWDVQVASCGTPVLMHDPHLGRTTNGVGPVRRRTLEQLQALDAGKWFNASFSGEKIPSLAEALELVAAAGVTVYCEVKGYRELEDLDRMARIVREKGMTDRTIFISMDYGVIDRIRGQDPEVGLGYIVEKAERFDDALGRAQTAGPRALIDFDHRLLKADPELVARCRAADVPIAVWTVDGKADAEAMVAMGVTRLTTNQVAHMKAWADTQ